MTRNTTTSTATTSNTTTSSSSHIDLGPWIQFGMNQ